MICIYHSRDLDGFASGAIVKLKYPDCILIGYDYGEELPIDRIPEGDSIIMVDVSMPMDKMETLAKHSGWNMTWIDHHATAIKDYEEFVGNGQSFCTPVLKSGIAACELAWAHLLGPIRLPRAILLLGEYDTWRNADKKHWENEVLPFQYGMRAYCNSPQTFPGHLFATNPDLIYDYISYGTAILAYQNRSNEVLCRRGAFEFNLSGLRVICLNSSGCNSISFASVYDPQKHDAMMPFFYDGRKWIFSLYTDKSDIDCSAIAKLRGGGGHRQAAGFEAAGFESVFNPY